MKIKIDTDIDTYIKKNFIKKAKIFVDHYKTREACMLVSANYKDYPIVAFLPKEYSASDNVGECYVLGKLATTFVETKNN